MSDKGNETKREKRAVDAGVRKLVKVAGYNFPTTASQVDQDQEKVSGSLIPDEVNKKRKRA